MSQIPTLDITRFDSDREAFVAELGAAYRQWGFAGIRNHGIPQADIDAAYDAFKAFFALPEEVKRKYTWPAAAAPAAIPRSAWNRQGLQALRPEGVLAHRS